MARYDQIKPVQMHFIKGQGLTRTLYYLEFPEQWKEPLLALARANTGRQNEKVNIHIRDLNDALRALLPDLIAIGRNATNPRSPTWLYSTTCIDPQFLTLIVRVWARARHDHVSPGLMQQLTSQISQEAIRWKEQTVDLAEWQVLPNETGAPLNTDTYSTLPQYLALYLCAPDAEFRLGNKLLHFYRFPCEPNQNGAELVSWPPLIHQDKSGNKWYWSVYMHLTYQTIPFTPQPALNWHFGVRRWVSRRPSGFGGRTSVALRTRVSWVQGLGASDSFRIARVRWVKTGDGFRLIWCDHLVDILQQLNPKHDLPDAQDLIDDPESWLNPDEMPNAAIEFRYGMRPQHKVSAGLSVEDRQDFVPQLADRLAGLGLEMVDLLPRAPSRQWKYHNVFFEEKGNRDGFTAQALRRQHIRDAVGEQLRLEIRYQSNTIRDALIHRLTETLGLDNTLPTQDSHNWHTPELDIHLQVLPLGGMGGPLCPDGTIQNSGDQALLAHQDRVDEIERNVPKVGTLTGTLVELPDQDKYPHNTDPKNALRLGLGRTGRLTQFITPAETLPDTASIRHRERWETERDSRARAAVFDLLRELGVLSGPPDTKVAGLPSSLSYLAIWLLCKTKRTTLAEQTQYLPVILRMASDSAEIEVTLPGAQRPLSYPDALLALAQSRVTSYDRAYKAMNFIEARIQEAISGDTLLICHAQNLQRCWPWITNTRILADQLSFSTDWSDPQPKPIANWPGLRVVRVRDNTNGETPQWYGEQVVEAQVQNGLPKGLFVINDRVFASTYGKPRQFKNVTHTSSKVKTRVDANGRTFPPNPEMAVFNPVMYELTVACLQEEDDPRVWAEAVHRLRDMTMHYNEPTALPLPLHLAKQLGEYLIDALGSADDEQSGE